MAVADPRPHRAQQAPVGRPWFGLHGRDEAVHHGADRCRLGESLHGSSGLYSAEYPKTLNQIKDAELQCWSEHQMKLHRKTKQIESGGFRTHAGVRGVLVVSAAADGDDQAAVGALPRPTRELILPLPVPRS